MPGDGSTSDAATMHIAFVTDEGYAGPLQGTIRSLAGSLAPGDSCVAHVGSLGLSAATRAEVEEAAGRVVVDWIDFEPDAVAGVRALEGSHLNVTSALRVTLPERLEGVERLVYLDVDVLVRHSLAPLSAMDLGQHVVAGVRDAGFGWVANPGEEVPLWLEFGLSADMRYLNAGVMVVDVAGWLERDLGRRCRELLAVNRFRYMEQDALNILLAGDWLALEPRWNLMTWFHRVDRGVAAHYESADLLCAALDDPAVVHFTGTAKPWSTGTAHVPFADEWRSAYGDTPAGRRSRKPGARLQRWASTARSRLRAARAASTGRTTQP